MEHQKQPIFTARFMSLFFTNMAVFFVFYGLVTTLPLYAMGVLGKSDDASGLLVTIFLLSAIFMRPFSGKLLDLFGKKKLLMISIIFYVICTVLYLFFKPFALLLALRFLQGIAFSIVTTAAGSLAADIIPANRKGTGLGYFAMSTNLAVVIGPFISLLVIQYASFDVLFIVLSIIVTIGALLAFTVKTSDLPKPLHVERNFKFGFNDLFEKKALPLAAIAGLIAFAYASVLSFLSLYAEQQNLLAAASYFYAIYAISMMSIRPLTGRIYDTLGAKYVIIPSFILFAIGLVVLANADSTWIFLVSAVFIGMGFGTLNTSFQSLAVQATVPQRTGYATATYFTLFDIGIALGSFVLGYVAVHLNYTVVYYLCAALVVCVFILYASFFVRNKQQA